MSVRATPVAKSVPMCTAPTSAIAAGGSSSATSMAFPVKVSPVVLLPYSCCKKHEQFHVIFHLKFKSLQYFLYFLTVFNEGLPPMPFFRSISFTCVVSFLLFTLNCSLAHFYNLTEICLFPEELPEFLVFSKWRYEHIYVLHM